VTGGLVDVVIPRAPEGLSLVLKPHHGARLYRVLPVRDPNQPRFWCLVVLRCSKMGAVEDGEAPWIIADGLTRDRLPAALAEIQADITAWLARESNQRLRDWLLEQLPDPLDVIRASGESRRRHGTHEATWEEEAEAFPAAIAHGLTTAEPTGQR
jgi:hypothetical protein